MLFSYKGRKKIQKEQSMAKKVNKKTSTTTMGRVIADVVRMSVFVLGD